METYTKSVAAATITACSRRVFLKKAALAGAAAVVTPALLAGCGSSSTTVAAPTLEQKIAQMLLVGFRGTELEESNYIVRDIREHRIGGVILFDRDAKLGTYARNITSPTQLQALTTSLRALSATPLLIAVDQEGGNVCRLKARYGFPPTVTAQYLGTLNNPIITRMAADSIGSTLAENGINMNFAPVTDLNINPTSPAIGYYERSFSADPAVVATHARIFVETHDKNHVATCLKHFPGHGSAVNDSHLGFVDVTDTWSEIELEPYRTLINEGNCRMVMTAHVFNKNIDPDLPATLSKPFITGLLREKLGFEGVVVTDDLQMQGLTQFFDYQTIVEKSILAGGDIILVSNNLEYDPEVVPTTISQVVALVRSGKITEERIDKSYQRIMALKQRIAVG
jgi:beta-N-acetylhexosaminidase